MTADDPAAHLSDAAPDVRSDMVDEVRALDDAATAVDDRSALSEQTWLRLRADVLSGTVDRHVHQLIRDTHGGLLAYAQLADHSAELVVHPQHRHRGIGTGIVTTLLERDPEVRIWSHAGHPDAARLAESAGLVVLRELWEMDRGLGAEHPLPELPTVPDGLTLRNFAPGHDDDAWVALNAAAFADHPEQGRITVDDLHARMAEPWFSSDDFFVAVEEPADGDEADDGKLVAFHWTKIVDGVGEVYVVGVDPGQQGRGLGKLMTLVGLHHFRTRGLNRATLFVDESNHAAVSTYAALGFHRAAVHVQYGAGRGRP